MNPRQTILVVDDDTAHRTMLRILLGWRYEVVEAADGAEAIEAVRGRAFDLVLMDVRMPRVSGIEALEAIKSMSPSTPVILMTAHAAPQAVEAARRKGAAGWLTKPFDFDELAEKIAASMTAPPPRPNRAGW